MENDELKEMAAQLRQPSGENGIAMAHMMNETNMGMTKNAIKNLQLEAGDHVLELGHGNCGHLAYLLEQAPNLHYDGLELSELMNQEAQASHPEFVAKGSANFSLYNGLKIPLIAKIYRVLKPQGKCSITFADSNFMEALPFTQFGFELYSIKKMEDLVASTPFQIIRIDEQTENVRTKMGDWVERKFNTIVLTK